ncbi:MAG TPA: hypothetical protein VGL00_11685 [Terracidiphilus sp.]
MSDTVPRNPVAASRLLADALLRSVSGTSARFRITAVNPDTSEVGLVSTAFAEINVAPVVMRKLRPAWQSDGAPKWELLVSASGVQQQVLALDLASAQSLFSMTLAVIIAGQSYIIESISSNEAFGEVYLYRLLLREARPQAV